MSTSSAVPDHLEAFVRASQALQDELKARFGALAEQYEAVVPALRWGTFDATALLADLAAWIRLNDADDAFVATVARAFRLAGGSGHLVSVDDASLERALGAQAGAARGSITVDDAIMAGLPPTSGFANDPVCTATGHFVLPETDLVLAPRLGPMSFARTYNSRWRRDGPLGRGWSSLASSRAIRGPDGVRIFFPDGRVALFRRSARGGFERVAGLKATLAAAGQGLVLTFLGQQRWSYDDRGRLAEVAPPDAPGVRLTWDGDHLVSLDHPAGRTVTLTWEGERIARARSSDGREVAYGYNEAGDLAEADGPLGRRTYETDGEGLLICVRDPDGVEVVRNTYDVEGRTLTQRSPLGRTARLRYLPGGVTVVDDEQEGPATTFLHDPAGRLIGVVDALGARMTKAYDEGGNPVAVADRTGAATINVFDRRGRLLERQSPSGAVTRWEWDEANRVVARTDPLAATVRMAYRGWDRTPSAVVDALGAVTRLSVDEGLIVSVTDPDGVLTTFGYDADGLVVCVGDAFGISTVERDPTGEIVAVRSPTGETWRFEHDPAGRPTRRVAPDGTAVSWDFSEGGRLLACVSAAGARSTFAWGPHGELESVTDACGGSVSYAYDAEGRLSRLTAPDGAVMSYRYDPLGRLVALTDPTGATTTREHDPEGRVVATTNAEGQRRTRAYDAEGRVVAEADALGNAVRYAWDGAGRLVALTDPTGATTTFAYDPVGRLVETADALGGVTRATWSAEGRLLAVSSPLGNTTTFGHDAAGRPVTATDATWATVSVSYDASGRVTRRTAPSGASVGYEHDACGRVAAVIGPGGGRTRLAYEPTGRIREVVDPTGARTAYVWDACGRPKEVVDPLGGSTRFGWNAAGLLTGILDPMGELERLAYDACGRVVGWTDRAGRERTSVLDLAGRPCVVADGGPGLRLWRDEAGRVVSYGPADRPSPQVRLTLDARGRATRIDEPGRTTTLAWDALGRITAKRAGSSSLGFRWDADSRRVATVHPDGEETLYAHDAAGRVTGVSHPRVGEVRINRDRDGEPVSLSAPGLTRRWFRRDGSVVRFVQQHGQRRMEVSFERDAAGRLIAEESDRGRTAYGRDAAGQLTAVTGPDGATLMFAYDAGGRLVAEAGPAGSRRLSYDPTGTLVAIEDGSARTTFDHDAAGRRTAERGPGRETAYAWDPLGRLASVETRSHGRLRTTRLTCDALGDLVTVDAVPLAWDPSSAVPALRDVGPTKVVGDLDPLGLAGPHEATWLPTDQRGTIGAPQDVWGPAAGHRLADSPPLELGWLGELEVGDLVWLRSRVYDPATRSFLTPDPLPPVPGRPTVANPYHFGHNDPLSFVDPLGLRPLTDQDLAALQDSMDRPVWERAGDSVHELASDPGTWLKAHVDEIAAGALTVGGVIMLFTPAAPIGAGILVGEGASLASQVVATGEVDARQLWVAGLAGGVTGGVASAATGLSAGVRTAAWVGSGAATSAGSQAILTNGHVDPAQVLIDAGVSGVLGRLVPAKAQAGWPPESEARLYRVVGTNEATDIRMARAYRNPPGLEGKYFYPTKEQAENLANLLKKSGWEDSMDLTSGRMSRRALSRVDPSDFLDIAGEGKAMFVRNELLDQIKNVTIHGQVD